MGSRIVSRIALKGIFGRCSWLAVCFYDISLMHFANEYCMNKYLGVTVFNR